MHMIGDPGTWKWISLILKYLCVVLTAVISIFSLWQADTYDIAAKRLTGRGKTHCWFIVIATVMALASAIAENFADKRLQEDAAREGDKKFVERLQASNQGLLDQLIPPLKQLNSSSAATQAELEQSADILKESSHTLEQSIKSVVPLKILEFTAQLSDWVEITGDISTDSKPNHFMPSTFRQRKMQDLTRVGTKSAKWSQIFCVQHEQEWTMRMNVTDILQVVLKSPGNIIKVQGDNGGGECRLQISVRTGSPILGFQETRLGAATDENDNTVFVRQQTRRSDLSESFQKAFHVNAVNSPEQQSFAVRVHTGQDNHKYDLLLPLRISAHLRVLAEGTDRTIEKSWRLNLDPRPLSPNPVDNLEWYAYYSPGKRNRQPLLYTNE